jgi:uroporphyrinogen-III synthase
LARAAAVYETREAALEAPPADLDAVLIYSAKAARAVVRLFSGTEVSAVAAYALSEPVAAALAGLEFRRIVTAPFPNEPALLNLLQG